MVLFHEKKKSKPVSKRRRRFRTGIKILLAFTVLFALSLVALANLGGNNDSLKKGLENYIASSTGMHTDIGILQNMAFYPDIKLQIEQITMTRPEQEEPAVTIGSMNITVDFWDLFLSRQNYKEFAAKNIKLAKDTASHLPIFLETVALQTDSYEERPGLLVNGTVGEDSLYLGMATRMEKNNKNETIYSLGDDNPFALRLGDISIDGTLKKNKNSGLTADLSQIGTPEKIASGSINLKGGLLGTLLSGELLFGNSKMVVDLALDAPKTTGNINFPVLMLEDINLLTNIISHLPLQNTLDLKGMALALDITITEIRNNDINLGGLSFPMKIADEHLSLGPIDGNFGDGLSTGQIDLSTKTTPASLELKVGFKQWDYGTIQKSFGKENFSGTADFHLHLEGKGNTANEIIKNLNGEAVLIGGEGKLASKTINRWGAGLVNAMIPSLDSESELKLNCLIADLKIENGIAKPAPLFIDTKRVTVVGEGSIDFTSRTIDLKFDPKAKNPALLDVATSVTMRGTFQNPKINPDTFSLFTKIGGLALGTINPAFLAFSMTDLGLINGHPCHKYIAPPKEDEKEEEEEEERPLIPREETNE